MEKSLAEILERMREMQRDVTEAKQVMTRMQEVQNQHSDAIMAIEGGGSGAKVKEEERCERKKQEDRSVFRSSADWPQSTEISKPLPGAGVYSI